MNADTRSVHTMSTIVDDVDKPDEADETGSFRSMSSTTSTNYGAPKPRSSATPLYTIPDEAAASEDGEEQQSSSQSETEAVQDLPASAAAQALHHEADELVMSSQHASSSANSLPDVPMDPTSGSDRKSGGLGKSLGSNASLSGASELSPVSEDESSRRTTSTGGFDGAHAAGQQSASSGTEVTAASGLLPKLHTDIISPADPTEIAVTPISSKAVADDPLTEGAMGNSGEELTADSLHTPRAMGPPATPGAPLVPKIDAGPAIGPAVQLEQPDTPVIAADTDVPESDQAESTMFAGLDMVSTGIN